MKYWAYFAGKMLLVAGLEYTLLVAALELFPPPQGNTQWFLRDMPFTFTVFGIWVIGSALVTLAIRDQRQRCRTCLRKLIMPVNSGSWANMLRLGRPSTDWMCPYGHGILHVEEVQLTGKEPPDWRPSDGDIWKELESYYQPQK